LFPKDRPAVVRVCKPVVYGIIKIMDEIWVIGAGWFGLHALRKLSQVRKDARFVVVDTNRDQLRQGEGPNRVLEQADGVSFVHEHLKPDEGPDWIIPALPIHLAAEWALARMGPDRLIRTEVPAELEGMVPNPMRGVSGDLYVSHAEFKCPEDCAEPADMCTVTRLPRKRNMFEILNEAAPDSYLPIVVRSHQLGAGIGGYRPRQLFEMLVQIEKVRGDLLVSTACRCHGVITALRRL